MSKPEPKKKPDISSVEAAALYLSDGRTTDPELATKIDRGVDLEMDGLQKAHLRRMMGFDFEMQQMPNVILITAKEKPFVRTRCKILEGETDKYGNIIAEALIDRLVEACLKLKQKREGLNAIR